MRRLMMFVLLLVLCCSCSSTPSVVFVEGGGSGRVLLEVDGAPVEMELEALAVSGGDGVEPCPVLTVAAWGATWRGTYPSAPERCRARHGVLGVAPASGTLDWGSVIDWGRRIVDVWL